ncbi:MAG: hypothetical protein ACUVRS_06720 [Armatimonadota bacterium]
MLKIGWKFVILVLSSCALGQVPHDVSLPPTLDNNNAVVCSAKYVIRPRSACSPGLAFAVRDVFNSDSHAERAQRSQVVLARKQEVCSR